MSLDGHMVITTKGSGFLQAWLTYVDPGQDTQDGDNDIFSEKPKESYDKIKIDEKRKMNFNLNLDKNLKIKNRSIFKSTTTVGDAFTKLLKNLAVSFKSNNCTDRDSITKPRLSIIKYDK
jgi:hypothetical protein